MEHPLDVKKKTLNTKENIDITKFQNLKSLMKNYSKGYKPKKSLIFKWDEIMKLMNSASDYIHLASKVIHVFGICGALRCDELTKLKLQDVEDLGNKYLVSINDTKNDQPRQFIIGQLFYGQIKQYISMRPNESFTDRFFIQYQKGKCHLQVIGRNKIGEIPQSIASYLNLPNPKQYTGHCFRRTGTTLFSESKHANPTMLKLLGGWKSINIAQGYVDNSLKNKETIYEGIIHAAASDIQPTTSNNNEDSKYTEKDNDNFSNDFVIDEEDLVAIYNINQSKEPKNKKILQTCNNQSKLSTHFTTKPPLNIFSNKSKNEPPRKKNKVLETDTSKQTFESTSTNQTLNQNPWNKYENCTFHGNIINYFHCSCIDSESEKTRQ